MTRTTGTAAPTSVADRTRRGGAAKGIERLADWSIRRRRLALCLWIVAVVVAFGGGMFTGVVEQSDADTLSGQAAVAERLLDESDFGEGAIENVLIQPKAGVSAGTDRIVADLRTRYRELTEVEQVGDPVTSPDGRSVLLPVHLDLGSGGARTLPKNVVGPMLEATQAVQKTHPDYSIAQVGAGSIGKEFSERYGQEFRRAEYVSLPITFAILLVTFGALVAAGVPVLLGMSAVLFGLGLASVTSFVLPANTNQPSLILLVGLAVGVDYSLFYIRRVREERALGRSPGDALHIAAATSGRAVVVSGVSVVVAMAGMFVAGNMIFSSLALGTILVVGVAVVGSLVVLPAVLSMLGDRIDRPRIPLLSRHTGVDKGSRVWEAVLRPVLKAPALAVVVGLLALGAAAWPITDMRLKMPSDEDLPRSYPVVRTLHEVVTAFPGESTSHVVVVEAPAAQHDQVVSALTALNDRARAAGGFAVTEEAKTVSSVDGRVTKMYVAVPDEANSPEAERTLDRLRTDLIPATVGRISGAVWAVGGPTAFNSDFSSVQEERLPYVVGFVVLLCLVVMLVAFRSILIALVTGLLNLISVAAAYGILVLVFQNDWAEPVLGFESNGAIVSWIPLILFVVLFGLSMDYHVFVLSRIREAVARGEEVRDAVRSGIVRSAGDVTSAAVIMVAVFALFATLSTLEMKQLGVGLAVAILLDATVVRGLLLPGLLALLGRSAWREMRFLRGLPSVAHD
ncbi:MMPL family transporter [Microbispora hainanensis]|uniref:MMPL family transporter n=1 Tax=Microbispora hainanensis TaxID=568844 RepID=UPI0034008ABB